MKIWLRFPWQLCFCKIFTRLKWRFLTREFSIAEITNNHDRCVLYESLVVCCAHSNKVKLLRMPYGSFCIVFHTLRLPEGCWQVLVNNRSVSHIYFLLDFHTIRIYVYSHLEVFIWVTSDLVSSRQKGNVRRLWDYRNHGVFRRRVAVYQPSYWRRCTSRATETRGRPQPCTPLDSRSLTSCISYRDSLTSLKRINVRTLRRRSHGKPGFRCYC